MCAAGTNHRIQLTEAKCSKRYGHSLFRENKTRQELKVEMNERLKSKILGTKLMPTQG